MEWGRECMNMFQIGIIGVVGALLAVQFKGGKPEYGIYMCAAVSILLFACMIDRLEIFVDAVEQGLPAPIPTSQIIYNQAIIDGIIRSCQCGHEVEVHVEEI